MLTYKKYTTNTARAGTVFSKAGCTAAYLFVGIAIVLAGVVLRPHSVFAADISVTPITWDIIGLDSNDPQTGPNQFPVGVRVCNNTAGDLTNVTGTFQWDGGGTATNTEVYLRPGTLQTVSIDLPDFLAAGACTDFYYEVEVNRTSAPYDKTRDYRVDVTSTETGATVFSSGVRQLYVEHLVSQNRNATTDVQYGTDPDALTPVEPGGTLSMMVGGTYYIKLIGSTATQGYEQLESFINIPNTIFRIIEVTTDYTADTSGTVSSPNDKLYGDGCLWENNLSSENLRSCLSTGKVGGGTEVLYKVEILQMPGAPLINPEPIQTLYYDFSGSSYHYNADWSASTRYIEIVTANITKSFSPKTILPGGTSTMTLTITNPGPDVLAGVNFFDNDNGDGTGWPTFGDMTFASNMLTYSDGCSASTTPTPDVDSLTPGGATVAFSDISIPGFGTCTITLEVTASAGGVYVNTTSNLLINGTTDTGSRGTDTLLVSSKPPITSCASPVPLAEWTFGALATGVNNGTFAGTTLIGDVANPIATFGNGGGAFSGIANGTIDPSPFRSENNKNINPVTQAPPADSNSWGIQDGWLGNNGVPTTGTPGSYFQFQIDASNYGAISIAAQANLQGSWGNGDEWYVFSSTDGSNWDQVGTGSWGGVNGFVSAWGTVNNQLNPDTAGTTYFRIMFAGAGGKTDETVFLDNISITGCPYPEYPTLSKAFADVSICQTDGTTPTLPVTTLTFTLTNPNAFDLAGVGFSDTLPDGLAIADPSSGLSTSCTSGSLTVATPIANAGTSIISLSGATLSAGADCTIAVDVVGNTAGQYKNVSGTITSTDTGPNTTAPPAADSGYGEADLQVIALPLIGKSFGSSTIFVGDTIPTPLVFSVRNPDTATTLTGINFSDPLPGGLIVASPNGLTGSCGGGTITAIAGSSSVGLADASLAPGVECTFSVNVVAPTGTAAPQSLTNSATVNTDQTCSNSVDVDFLIKVREPKINLLKQVGPSASGPWTKYLPVTPTSLGPPAIYPDVYYRFIVENIGDLPLTSATLTDSNIDVSSCATVLSGGLALYETKTCVSGAVSISEPGFINTAAVEGSDGITTVQNECLDVTGLDVCQAQHETSQLVLDKQVNSISTGGATFNVAGDIITYDYVVTNNGADLIDPVVISDNKIGSITCPSVTNSVPTGIFADRLEAGEVLTCTATYTVTGDDVNFGFVTNLASASAPLQSTPSTSVTSNTDWVSVGKTGLTYASLASFDAYINNKNEVALEWTTASETGTIGFLLERLNEQTGEYKKVTKELLPSMLSAPHGGTYRYVDKKAEIGRAYTYRVVEVAVNHLGTVSGPYTVQATQPLPENEQMVAEGAKGYTMAPEAFTKKQLKRFVSRDKAARKLAEKRKKKAGEVLKIPVSRNGLVYLNAAELASISGLSQDQVVRYLKGRRCLVTLAGKSIPVITARAGSALWFYGQAPDRNDIGQNIYLLELGRKGVKMKNTPGRAKEIVRDEQSFFAHTKVEKNEMPFHLYINKPVNDFWAWDYLTPYRSEASYSVATPKAILQGSALVTVNLVGITNINSGESASYRARVMLNGDEIGIAEWSEDGDYRFQTEVSADQLQDGENEIRLVLQLGNGVTYSLIYIDSFEVDYLRRYEAINGELFFNAEENKSITIQGITGSNVLVLDITDPTAPQRVRTLSTKVKASEYTATILTEPDHSYLFTENINDSVLGALTVDTPSYLMSTSNQADYLIITSLDMMDSVQRLADYRSNQGLNSLVVDIEDIQDEFSSSLAAPEAIRDFLAYVYENWSVVPRYVALVGDGSFDYKDYLDYGYPSVPSVLVQTDEGFFPSDNTFSDVVNGDGVPEFAMGRIPVYNTSELDNYIDKLIKYEQSGKKSHMNLTLAIDQSDSVAGDFHLSGEKVQALMPENFVVNRLSADEGLGKVHAGIINAFQQGSGIIHYIGHSSMWTLGRRNSLLSTAEMDSMDNIGTPLLMVSMSCSVASFGYPEMNSIGETAVLRPDGAAVGFFGSTGLSRNDLADIMAEGFYKSLFNPENPRLGDVVREAKVYYSHQGVTAYPLDIYNLLGDPATFVPAQH